MGPYEVVTFTSPVIVQLRDQQGGDLKTAHLSELKVFTEPLSLSNVASPEQ